MITRPESLTLRQFALLRALHESPMTVSEASRFSKCRSRSGVSQFAARAIRRGYIEARSYHKENGKELTLTDSGRELLADGLSFLESRIP